MEVIVTKFGGSSLSDSTQFQKVKDIVLADDRRCYVTASAPGKRNKSDYKVTDLLYLCYEHIEKSLPFDELFKLIEERYIVMCSELKLSINISKYLLEFKEELSKGASEAYIVSRGEYFNALILSQYLGYEFIDASEIIVFNKSGILDEVATYATLRSRLSKVEKAVIPGFYGACADGTIKTFSRGGSDITGAIVAKGVGAKIYENWTDVSGILIADPNIVNNPKPINEITYKELRELSYMGANVFHEEAIFPVKNDGIPINIKNTNKPFDRGTFISNNKSEGKTNNITGISGKKDVTVIWIEKRLMDSDIGYFQRVMSILKNNNVCFHHMQSGIDSISIVIDDSDIGNTLNIILQQIENQCSPDLILTYPNISLIAVVGKAFRVKKEIPAKMFKILSEYDINIRMINRESSELSIIVGVENENFESAIRALYNTFEN